MLELPEPTGIFLDHVQSRIELHGEDHRTAIDMSLTYTDNNRVLDAVAPGLRAALFTAHVKQPAKAKAGQQAMDLPVDDMPHLRAPQIVPPVRLDCETEGATVTIEHGVRKDIVLAPCRVHKLRATAIEGGSVELKFVVSCASGIDAEVIGQLSMKQQQEVRMTLRPPEAAVDGTGKQATAAGAGKAGPDQGWPFPNATPRSPADKANRAQQKKAAAPARKGAAVRKDATDTFLAQHGGAA